MPFDEPFDDDEDYEESDEDSEDEPLVKKLRGITRDQKKRLKELERQLAANEEAARELAFLKAGLPDTPQVRFFLSHYDGEYTSEAIRAKAAEYGFLEVDSQTKDEIDEVEAMMVASRGSQSPAAPGTDRAIAEKIAMVKPGPRAADQIAQILKDHGRYQEDE